MKDPTFRDSAASSAPVRQSVTRASDQRRARHTLAQLSALHCSLEARLGSGANPGLDRVLGDILSRRAGQQERLAAWLGEGTKGGKSFRDDPVSESPDPRDDRPHKARKKGKKSKALVNVRVLQRRDLTSELLTFRLSRPPEFVFSAGASVKVVLGGLSRRYSIVSAPHEPFIELFVELIPQGRMSAQWQGVKEGDELGIRSPKAGLPLAEDVRNHLMVATVTGVNPFVSMVRDAVHKGRGGQRFLLIQGASFAPELGYSDELAAVAEAYPQLLTYVPTVSRPGASENSSWAGAQGRVGEHVEAQLKLAGWGPADTCLYACGNPAMVDDIEQVWRGRGFEVRTERYK